MARQAGVSLATASRALGNSRDRVSDELTGRVLQAADELNYVPNANARALVETTTSTMGLVLPDVSDPYFAGIARGVLDAADELDHLVTICHTFCSPDREIEQVATLRSHRAHAILLAGSRWSDTRTEERLVRQLDAYRATQGRVASIGRRRAPVDTVLPDNHDGATRVAHHLADLGHRDIAVITGPPQLTTVVDRLEGFRAGLTERGLQLHDANVHPGDLARAGGHAATLRILDTTPQTTAIFALNDLMAIGAISALRERGVAVPHQMSVVGFDDIAPGSDITPTLTTIRIPMGELGTLAVELALSPHDESAPGSGR